MPAQVDYYAGHESPSRWMGSGLGRVGLQAGGPVDAEVFARLMRHETPEGESMVRRFASHGRVAAFRESLPEAVAFAVIDLITGPLLDNPRRIGAPLRDELAGVWSARRGTYRVLYRIDDDKREVIVLRIGHRRDVYRPD